MGTSKDKSAKKKETRGRPSLFTDRLANKIIELSSKGATVAQIAEITSINEATIYAWMGSKADFSEAVKEARLIADELVEASLFRKAIGYNHPDTKYFCHEGSVIAEPTVKHYPPDTTAAIFWLKNRQPDKWREKLEVEKKVTVEPFIIRRFDSNEVLELGTKEVTKDEDVYELDGNSE